MLQDLANIFIVLGTIVAATTALLAWRTYINRNIESQVAELRKKLATCQMDFDQIRDNFVKEGISEAVGQVMGHPKIEEFVHFLWTIKKLPHDDFKRLVDKCSHQVTAAVIDALLRDSGTSLTKHKSSFQTSIIFVKPRFPVLHTFLEHTNTIIDYALRVPRDHETVTKLITDAVVKFHENNEFKDLPTPSVIHGLLHNVLLANLEREINNQKLKELFKALDKLFEMITEPYLLRSEKAVWIESSSEMLLPLEKYRTGMVSKDLWLIAEAKKSLLQGSYDDFKYHSQEAFNILKAD